MDFVRTTIARPLRRSKLRKWTGVKYYCLKRCLAWVLGSVKFARKESCILPELVFQHRSMILRPLKDVDMYLQHNKKRNLELAADKINHVVIRPGEVFSFWKLVGKTSASKGYLEGLVLDGGKITKGIGGGLCQFGNLLYWVALHSPLTITERYRHGYDVFPDVNRTIPFACGATLSYNYIDLQIKNTTNESFQFHVWVDETHLNCELLSTKELPCSYKVFETDHQFVQQIWGGYTRHNRIWKEVTDKRSGEIVTELITENSAIMMYSPLLSTRKV